MEAIFLYIVNILVGWALPEATKEAIGLIRKETLYYGVSEEELDDEESIKSTLTMTRHKKGETPTIVTSQDNDAPDEEAVYHYIFSSYKPVGFYAVNTLGELYHQQDIEIGGKNFFCYRTEHKCYKKIGLSWEPKYA